MSKLIRHFYKDLSKTDYSYFSRFNTRMVPFNISKQQILFKEVIPNIPIIYFNFLEGLRDLDLHYLKEICEPLFYVKLIEHLNEINNQGYVLELSGEEHIGE